MRIYHYRGDTGEFTGQSEAPLDPLETKRAGEAKYLIPALATIKESPLAGENQAAVFDQATGEWSIVPDYRGQVRYDPETGQGIEVDTVGVKPVGPEVPPPADLLKARWSGAEWIEAATAEDIAARDRETAIAELAATDAGMARVAEDLVEILLAKSLIQESDIPRAVRDKIAARKALRASISS